MTSLEIGLIGILGSLAVGVAVRQVTQSKLVTRKECEANHQHESSRHDQVLEEMQAMKRQLQAQSRMIRALVVHSGMDKHKQQQILNEREFD